MAEILKTNDFSGGETDFYRDGPVTQAKEMTNLVVTRNRKATTRPGSALFDSAHAQTALGSVRIGKVYTDGTETLLCQSTRLYRYSSGWTELKGPGGTDYAFPYSTTASSYSVAKWNNHFFITSDDLQTPVRKVFKDGSAGWMITNAGLGSLTFATNYPVFTPSAGTGSHSYIYFFVLSTTYTLDTGVTFVDTGPVITATATSNVALGGAVTMGIDAAAGAGVWPKPTNVSGNIVNTSTVIDFYRTTDGGTIGYYFGSQSGAGGTGITDTSTDAFLIGQQQLYITGDVLDYDPPPLAKYLTISNDICWYGHVKESDGLKPYRVRQSIQFSPDKCPASLYIDVDGDITGIASIGNTPIVFCKDKFYRLEGYVDNLGAGFTRKVIVSDTVGCISNDSIIQSQKGICFAAEDGFYYTDGYTFTRVSDNKTTSYAGLVAAGGTVSAALRQKRITGAYDKLSDRYYWAVQSDDDSTDNDAIWVFDANFGIKTDGCFTTHASGVDYNPTALAFVGGNLLRADKNGYLFRHSTELYTDLVIGSPAAAATWTTKAVPYTYTSCAYTFGTEDQKKYVTRMLLSCDNETNLSLQVSGCNNDSGAWHDLKEIKYRGNILWGDADVLWGDETAVWNSTGAIIGERRFPAGSLRCIFKQIRFQNSVTIVGRSDDYEAATVSKSGKTAYFPTLTWATNCENYALYFEWDGYTEAFPIVSRTSDTLTLEDTAAHLRDGSWKWEMKGYRKSERIIMSSYLIGYELFQQGINGWQKTEDGSNA